MESKKKVNVAFKGYQEPKFLQQLRAKHGLMSKEEEEKEKITAKSVDNKRYVQLQDSHVDVKDADQPQVVVLKEGQLSKEEAELAIAQGAKGIEGVLSAANKTKPVKDKGSKKKAKSEPDAKRAKSLSKKNANTLSFADEDEDDDDL